MCVDGLDRKAEARGEAESPVKVVVDHVQYKELGVINLQPRHH